MFARPLRFVLVTLSLLAGSSCIVRTPSTDPKSANPSGKQGPSGVAGGAGSHEDEAPNAVTTGLPATAAHASLAWFIGRIGDLPDATLGGTAQSKVDGTKALSFVAELAIGDVAPSILRTRHLPKTATALAAVKPITDAASLKVAVTLVSDAKKLAHDELATITSSSDKSNAQTASERTFEALDALLSDLGVRSAAAPAPIPDRLLSSWVALFEGSNDVTQIELLERDVPLVVTLLKTGVAPKRTTKTAPRWVHPAIRSFLVKMSSMPLADYAQLLGIDVTDTLRGRNVDVHVLGADVSLRELAPRVLESCKDAEDAAKLRALKPIHDEPSLMAGLEVLGPMTDDTNPKHLCAQAASNSAQPVSEAVTAFDYLKKKINDHPYYARTAIVGWSGALGELHGAGVDHEELLKLASGYLSGFATKVRAMPRRKETTREPT